MGLENRSELGEPPEDPHVAERLPHALTAGEEASMTTTEKSDLYMTRMPFLPNTCDIFS